MSDTSGLVVFVDDDELLRVANSQSLSLAGFNVRTYPDAISALQDIDKLFDGVVVSDIRMPEMDGIQFFQAIQQIDPEIPVILITGHGDVPMAVSALKSGVHDFLSKPFAAEHLIATVRSACNLRSLQLENRRLHQAAMLASRKSPLIGETPSMVRLRVTLDQIANANVDVIIEGETGTGKELIARLIHRASNGRSGAFVLVQCDGSSPELLESSLFGDALPGHSRSKLGQIEAAHKGTLFLDDVDRMPSSTQARLMQFLEDGVLRNNQSSLERPIEVRIIASSKTSLLNAVHQHGFREDLYYRLNTARLAVPPIRERKDDIPLLFAHFVGEATPRNSSSWPDISEGVRRHLYDHDWPGNVRELNAFATRFALNLLEPEETGSLSSSREPLSERTRSYERSIIEDALRRCHGDVSATLKELQLPRKTFYDKLTRHGIEINDFRHKNT